MTCFDFEPIREVLDRAADRGQRFELWWRDDDAIRHSAALDRLLQLGRSYGVPLAIAAVPAHLDPSLAERLRREESARVLVHGFRHADHARPGNKRAEFGPERSLPEMEDEARRGLETIRSSFGHQALPVFVPPWNRFDERLPARLSHLGFCGISAFGPRGCPEAAEVRTLNTHLDPVDWRGSRGGVEMRQLASALERAAGSSKEGVEPLGVLTHHLVFDQDLWSLTAGLVETLARHPAIRIPTLDALWLAQKRH